MAVATGSYGADVLLAAGAEVVLAGAQTDGEELLGLVETTQTYESR